eukprot:3915283-Rhodomonas_salina.2
MASPSLPLALCLTRRRLGFEPPRLLVRWRAAGGCWRLQPCSARAWGFCKGGSSRGPTVA